MKAAYGLTGQERKDLVNALGEIIGEKPKYKGVPSLAFQIGEVTVSKDGTCDFGILPESEAERIMKELEGRGFKPEGTENEPLEDNEKTTETVETQDDELTVSMPKESFTEESLANLKKIIESKGSLMKKAFGTTELPILEEEEKIVFPWFKLEGDGDALAYMHFVEAICKMAKTQTRITAKEKEVENEKYAFRCFLLRLGFIGKEYKSDRKILLKNLEGSSAFKNGNKEDEA